MSTTKILRQGLSSLLKSNIIEILAGITDTEKALDLLKQNFTFTHSEIAKNFQDSYGYALAAISSGLAAPENQRGFWRSLFQSNVESEFSQGLEQDYLLPFAQQQGLADEKLSAFRQTAVAQCQQMATLTLFEADNAPFSETELASFVTASGANSMTDLVVELVQTQQSLDKRVRAFLQFEELLGNTLLFFLHEQLRKEPRFQSTLSALQREGLIIDVREIKQIVQSTENKLNQALTKKQFGEVAQLGQQLERLQQIESVTQSHYAQFIEFSQRFADWAQLVNLQLKEVLAALPKLQAQLGGIKSDTEEILAIVQQLMARADLSPQVKPRDELTQYNSANLELIGQARQLLKRIPSSDPQYSRAAIGLGSVVSSQGDLKQAEALFIKAYQQASNDKERALSAFNLFQVFTRQHVYDQALSSLQEAIKLNQQRYALHNVHTYTLQRILGAGGMGCVFLARHRLKKESVVIKCFWETLHGSADALFKEAFLMSEIAGEYVPQPLDCGFVDLTKQERGYFISEYIEGAIDGETWLAKHGKLDVPTGIAVGLQIAKGLQLAHDKGIFHLDLKPANILLQQQDEIVVKIIEHDNGIFHLDLKPANILLQQQNEIVVKIIDFGLAKVAPSLGQEMATQRSRSGLSLLAQSAVFGTMDYAPPEQQGMTLYGEPNAKSDVYAFGKTLYRLLTGESPQTLHPRRLADAPELFELLCDCVEIEPGKRVDVATLIIQLSALHAEILKKRRTWWNQLDDNWKNVFMFNIGKIPIWDKALIKAFDGEPTDSDLEKIVNLQEFDCHMNQMSDLEPLRALTKLQTLDCSWNKISDLEPLRALTNLQKLLCEYNQLSDLEPLRALMNLQRLDCGGNQLSDLEPLRALTNLQKLLCEDNQLRVLEPLRALMKLSNLWCFQNQISDLEPLRTLTKLRYLVCNENQISDLEPLRTLTNLHSLSCAGNQLSDSELDKFKKAVPNCGVS